jgi:anti-sigma factor RsiW
MSRDTRDRASEREPELLTAYVDGVAELPTDQRRRIEAQLARDPEARTDEVAVRALLDRLRALPPEGDEPNWAAMERSIRDAVGNDVPRRWWRSWRWLAPTATLATAMIVLFVMWARPGERLVERLVAPPTAPEQSAHPHESARQTGDDTVALWLDGGEVDVALSASDLLGDAAAGDDEPPADDEVGLLPATDLAWVDRLDDDALARAERWLTGETESPGPAPRRKG